MIWSRLLIAAILCYLGYRLIKKKNPSRKKQHFVLLGIILILFIAVSEIFPPENLFITFPTPEDAIQYRSGKGRDYLLRIDGQETTLLFYRENDSTLTIEPAKKYNDGWKMTNGFGSFPFAGGFIDIGETQPLATDFILQESDAYLQVTKTGETELIISDNRDSDFQRLDGTWLAYIGTTDGYVLTVNGKNYMPTLKKESVGYVVTWTEI